MSDTETTTNDFVQKNLKMYFSTIYLIFYRVYARNFNKLHPPNTKSHLN